MNVKTKIMFEQGYMYVFCGTYMSRGSFLALVLLVTVLPALVLSALVLPELLIRALVLLALVLLALVLPAPLLLLQIRGQCIQC